MKLTTILIIVLCIAAGLALCLALGYFGVAPFDSFYVSAQAATANISIPDVLTNPTTIVAGVGSAVAIGVPLISKLNSAKKQVTEAKASLSAVENKASNLASDVSSKTSALEETSLSLESAQARIKELEASQKILQAKAEGFIVTNQQLIDELKLKPKEIIKEVVK
jgi:hypothetical protein